MTSYTNVPPRPEPKMLGSVVFTHMDGNSSSEVNAELQQLRAKVKSYIRIQVALIVWIALLTLVLAFRH